MCSKEALRLLAARGTVGTSSPTISSLESSLREHASVSGLSDGFTNTTERSLEEDANIHIHDGGRDGQIFDCIRSGGLQPDSSIAQEGSGLLKGKSGAQDESYVFNERWKKTDYGNNNQVNVQAYSGGSQATFGESQFSGLDYWTSETEIHNERFAGPTTWDALWSEWESENLS